MKIRRSRGGIVADLGFALISCFAAACSSLHCNEERYRESVLRALSQRAAKLDL